MTVPPSVSPVRTSSARTIPGPYDWTPGVLVVVLGLALMIAAAVALASTIGRFQDNQVRLRHDDDVLSQVSLAEAKIYGVGIAERGYLIIGDQRYLQQYTRLRNELPDALQSLRDLTAGSPEQRRIMDDLLQAFRDRVAIMDEVIALGPTKLADAMPTLRGSRPLRLNETILDGLSHVRVLELERRASHFDEADRLTGAAVTMAGVIAMLAVLSAGCAGLVFVRRSRLFREERERHTFNHNARLLAAREAVQVTASELARPLAIALNYLGTAENPHRRGTTADPDRMATVLRMVMNQVGTANDIVNRLRDRSGGEGNLRMPVALAPLILEVVARLDFLTPGGVVDVTIADGLPPVLVDAARVQQVLINLLDDSTNPPERPTHRVVTISARPDDSGMVRVRVEDTGRALTDEDAADIFEPFANRSGKNQGLGPAICRRIIRANGGQIWLEFHSSERVVFCFTLPVAPEDWPAPGDLNSPASR